MIQVLFATMFLNWKVFTVGEYKCDFSWPLGYAMAYYHPEDRSLDMFRHDYPSMVCRAERMQP
jgi:hypothetical protein